ncbi:hypothetical protein H7849_14175 [Alloacidobacterium dinghuense]|uniref:DUF1579 domain-containing protein n=1 Tax=Alloacidobacterium dinghuense TaxID=2763107 RepID=A0A7G8BCQ3_9BACT|nr:hypothetical protein [Alloacidobacterium dinghuense]QNI30323.1 hypothetical protein H7849_14175 [Alloacidobacterium dinghuense]
MRTALVTACLSMVAITAAAQGFPDSVYAPLWNYNGTWKVSIPGKPTDTLINHCSRTGLFFACEQNVNGNPGALVVFVPIDAEGHYRTNPITKDGAAIGPGDLEIKDNHWTYLGKSEADGKTTWYRTTNDFSDDSHIHFEQAQSTDKVHWEVQRTGDEVRTDKGTK